MRSLRPLGASFPTELSKDRQYERAFPDITRTIAGSGGRLSESGGSGREHWPGGMYVSWQALRNGTVEALGLRQVHMRLIAGGAKESGEGRAQIAGRAHRGPPRAHRQGTDPSRNDPLCGGIGEVMET